MSNVPNINIQNDNGETLLHQICEQKDYIDEEKRKEFILLLLEKGSNPTIKDNVYLFEYLSLRNINHYQKNRMEKHVKIMQKKMENKPLKH